MRTFLSHDSAASPFGPCQDRGRGRWSVSFTFSFCLHLLALMVLCWQPAPLFVKPAFLARGENGSAAPVAVALYLPRDLQIQPEAYPAQLNFPAARKHRDALKRKRHNILEEDNTARRAEIGSTLGSSVDGPAYGDEVKPALPVSFADPAISRWELPSGLKGDVIVEVTIDAGGKVVEEKLLQGLGPGIDEKVLAAVREWRYRPATRNGIPIPSKHDVRYHFPS